MHYAEKYIQSQVCLVLMFFHIIKFLCVSRDICYIHVYTDDIVYTHSIKLLRKPVQNTVQNGWLCLDVWPVSHFIDNLLYKVL